MSKKDFISLRGVCKSYDKRSVVLSDFSLDIEEGSFVSILGTSGSGKSTILNLIAGFIKPDRGKIMINGVDIKDVPPHQRPTSTVFQDYALFPHMNVFENIAFGLRKMFTNKENVKEEFYEKIDSLHLEAVNKSQSKISSLNEKIREFSDKCEFIKEGAVHSKRKFAR